MPNEAMGLALGAGAMWPTIQRFGYLMFSIAVLTSHAGEGREDAIHTVELQHAEVWSKGRVELIPEIYTPDFVGHFPGGAVRGQNGIRERVLTHRAAFPDWNETIVDSICEGDKVATRFVSRGTNLGPFLGSPATGNSVEISEVAIYRLSGGKIAEQWVYPDMLAMEQQLSAKPD